MKNQIGKIFGNELISSLNRAAKIKIRLELKGYNLLDEMSKEIEALTIEELQHLTETIKILDQCLDNIEATKL